jgi:heavy metal sensor kinase
MVRSIRVRLQLWYAAVLLAVVAGLTSTVYLEARQSRLGQVDERLKAAANYLDATLRGMPPHEVEGLPPAGKGPPGRGSPGKGPPGKGPFGKAPPDLEPRGADDGGAAVDVAIWRADGSVLKASDTPPPPRPALAVADWPTPGEAYCTGVGTRREAFAAGPRGVLIRVGRSVERELFELRRLAWQLAGGGVLAMAVGLVGGWWVSSRILRPVAAIADSAAAISATNLSQRIDAAHLDSELVGLAYVLNDAFARLEGSFERQVRFTADASHELRTPLAVLSAHAESALARTRTDEEYRDAMRAVQRAAVRMRKLVDGLLTLARADAGKLDLSRKLVDLRSVVEEAADHYLPAAQKAGVELLTEAPNTPMRISGDAAFLGRVAENLIDNALRHTPAGGRVTASLGAEGGRAVLAVSDTGSGIPEADLPRVFERFYRADAARSRKSGGVGLGLAICKGIVEAHGGTIAVASQPGRGTTVRVELP